jgi:hypothetical protein
MSVEEAKKVAAALGNMFQRVATDGEHIEEHKALVFDCGTGETKAILWHYKAADGGTIQMRELDKAPAVLHFLEGKKAADNEDYKALLNEANNKIAQGADREEALRRLRDGFWFLDAKPADAVGG